MEEKPQLVSGRKTVLIVEDNPVQAFSLVQLLKKEGLNVVCAPNGITGLSMAIEYSPDLVVMDVQMPEMDGIEATRRLKEDSRTVGIPIIVFTGLARPDIFQQTEGGAVDFIPKDAFSDYVLLDTLREMKFIKPKPSDSTKAANT